MTTSTKQLAEQFAAINGDFSSFWQTRKEHGLFDEVSSKGFHKHLVSSKGFREQCLELIQQALEHHGAASDTFKKIAEHNPGTPGAAEGFAAAYGICCAWKTDHLKDFWKGAMEIATNLAPSLVTNYFRRGFWAVPSYSRLLIKEAVWGDASMGVLLLNGPKHLQSYQTEDLANNVSGIYRYFELLKKDPACLDEWREVEGQFQVLVRDDILPMAFPPARDVRHLVLGDHIVKGTECSAITEALTGYLTDDSFSLKDIADNMAVLEHHASYLKVAFSADFSSAVLKASNDGEDDVPTNDDGGCSATEMFKAKFHLLHETLIKHHPAPDAILAVWVFKKQMGECLDIRDQHEGDPLWVQKQLMLQLGKSVGAKSVRSRVAYAQAERDWVFLETLLETLSQDDVRLVCGHSDLGRELGFRVNGDTWLLEGVDDEKTLSSALECALGI
jgi:hypothetical protein